MQSALVDVVVELDLRVGDSQLKGLEESIVKTSVHRLELRGGVENGGWNFII